MREKWCKPSKLTEHIQIIWNYMYMYIDTVNYVNLIKKLRIFKLFLLYSNQGLMNFCYYIHKEHFSFFDTKIHFSTFFIDTTFITSVPLVTNLVLSTEWYTTEGRQRRDCRIGQQASDGGVLFSHSWCQLLRQDPRNGRKVCTVFATLKNCNLFNDCIIGLFVCKILQYHLQYKNTTQEMCLILFWQLSVLSCIQN